MSENVLFVRSEEDDDPWDDSLLIKAYDSALSRAKKEIMKDEPGGSGMSNKRRKAARWLKGQCCRAKYSEDGIWYEAKILRLNGDKAAVKYLGYGNVETVNLDDLEPSHGCVARQTQKREAKSSVVVETDNDAMATEDSSSNADFNPQPLPQQLHEPHFQSDMPFPPPPLPPPGFFRREQPPSDDEALYSMLMSWYMSGYHTGYYEGKKASVRS